MRNVINFYLKNMYDKYKYHAIWLPSRAVKVGQIGIFENNLFIAHTSLEDLGIPFSAEKNTSGDYLEYKSNDSIKVFSKIQGEAGENFSILPLSDAGISVNFNSASGVFFKAVGVTIHEIKNLSQINNKILELEKTGEWNDKYVLINEVIEVDYATIIVSNSRDGKLELKANGAIAGKVLDIVDASLDFQVLIESGIETKVIAKNGMTPLFKAVGLKKEMLTSRKVFDKNHEGFSELQLMDIPYFEEDLLEK